jgi:cytochrome c-type biogenesis protein CcmH
MTTLTHRRPVRPFFSALALIATLLLTVSAVPAMAATEPLTFANEDAQRRFNDLAAELRCLVCQNQSLADSDAPLARDLRRELQELIRSGRSDTEIKTYLTDRYGEFVLYRPPFDARTWWLWIGPGILVLLALGAVALIVRQRRRMAGNDARALEPKDDEEW